TLPRRLMGGQGEGPLLRLGRSPRPTRGSCPRRVTSGRLRFAQQRGCADWAKAGRTKPTSRALAWPGPSVDGGNWAEYNKCGRVCLALEGHQVGAQRGGLARPEV